MIVEYEAKYEDDVKDLLVELQEYLAEIDKEKLNICTKEYRDKYFEDTMKIVTESQGKIFLELDNEKAIGLCIGIINNEKEERYDFIAPRRGRIKELVVSKNYRGKGYGKKLLEYTKEYLKSVGCEFILIAVLSYNENAKRLYEANGFHARLEDMIEKV
ncbi:MAG: GNAT family N-acetyltransferase [Clostridia bacterium]|nr:GNAT family N-acetyltransferase [Clostridia bacterium]